MTPFHPRITAHERDLLARWVALGWSVRAMAKRLGRSPSSVSEELRRNRGGEGYLASAAQQLCERRKHASAQAGSRKPRWVTQYIEDKLRCGWSPEQIAGKLKKDARGQTIICHESIYQYIHHPRNHGDGWYEYLPRAHKTRRQWHTRSQYRRGIAGRVSIHDRPEVIQHRKTFGHWELDVVEGPRHQGGMVTALERVSRYYQAHLIPVIDSEYGIAAQLTILGAFPKHARKTATFDNGRENYNHDQLRLKLDMSTYFCDPYSAWQKGSNEYHNGVLRRYIPKKAPLTLIQEELIEIVEEINAKPRKCLNYATPTEIFTHFLYTREKG